MSFLLCLGASLSQADEVALPTLPAHLSVDPPVGWDLLPGLSAKIAQTSEQTAHFGEEASTGGALAYGRANRGALYLTWVDGVAAHPSPEAAIRLAFDGVHESPFLAATEAGAVQEVLYREKNSGSLAELNFEWAHMNNDTVNVVRALGWKDQSGRVHLAIGECVLHNESVGESRPLCESALASLHLGKDVKLEALQALAEPKAVGAAAAQDLTVPELESDEPAHKGPSLNAVPPNVGEVLYTGPPPPTNQDKSNRILIGLGILLLGAAFWLTTRSKPDPLEKSKGAGKSESDEDDQSEGEAEEESEEAQEKTE
jgi:hypothetical protein